jgi:hypothetical protein
MSRPANHPPSCTVCRGTGWQPGPDIESVANGQIVHYSSVEPCTNHWSNDAPTRTRLLHYREYLDALAARNDREQLLLFERNQDRWTL